MLLVAVVAVLPLLIDASTLLAPFCFFLLFLIFLFSPMLPFLAIVYPPFPTSVAHLARPTLFALIVIAGGASFLSLSTIQALIATIAVAPIIVSSLRPLFPLLSDASTLLAPFSFYLLLFIVLFANLLPTFVTV